MKFRVALLISVIALIGLSLLLLQMLPAISVATPTTRLTSTPVSTLSAPTYTHQPVSTPTQPNSAWTKVAVTQSAIATQRGVITQAPFPTAYYPRPDEFPAPGAAWLEYHDPNGEYNFKYPANWYLTQMDTVAVTNHSLNNGFVKDMVFNPDYMRFDVTRQKSLEPNQSFDDYIKSMNWGGQKVLSIGPEIVLASGLRTYHVRVETGHSAGGDLFFDYITDGTKVFALIVWADRPYSYVQEKAVESFTFPNDFPAPAKEWLEYHDTKYGISFKYPANWFVITPGEIAIANYNFNYCCEKGLGSIVNATRIGIWPQRSLNPNESLDDYVASTINASQLISKELTVTLENGIQVSKLVILQKARLWTEGVTFITDGTKVFEFFVVINDGKNKPNASVLDYLVKTVSIP